MQEQVHGAVGRWPEFAASAGVKPDWIRQIGESHRLELAPPTSTGQRKGDNEMIAGWWTSFLVTADR
jgi:hypothetical protein